jgi:hypothetical protein
MKYWKCELYRMLHGHFNYLEEFVKKNFWWNIKKYEDWLYLHLDNYSNLEFLINIEKEIEYFYKNDKLLTKRAIKYWQWNPSKYKLWYKAFLIKEYCFDRYLEKNNTIINDDKIKLKLLKMFNFIIKYYRDTDYTSITKTIILKKKFLDWEKIDLNSHIYDRNLIYEYLNKKY